MLKHCTDVRSLSSMKLDPEERALLPGDVKDIKVFEILFEGRAREKFATTSIRERARWVSAIWDAILHKASGSVNQLDDAKTFSPVANGIPTTSTSVHVGSNSTSASGFSDRALPPVPEQPNSPVVSVLSPSPRVPVSPSIYPPTRPGSRASSIHSQSQSPSIANLGHRSVVKQRLSQIEGNQACRSTSASPSPSCQNSSRSRPTTPRPFQAQRPSRDNANGCVSPTAIVYSFADSNETCREAAQFMVANSITLPNCPDQESTRPLADLQDERKQLGDSAIRAISFPCLQNLSSCPTSEAHECQPLLVDIHQIISGVAQRTEETRNVLDAIQDKIDQGTKPNPNHEDMVAALRGVRETLRSDLPSIMKSLSEIQASRGDLDGKAVSLVMANCESDKLDQILELFREDILQRSAQGQQQTDSVRYLNELNSWLETFVSGGTAQIQAVAAGVDKLCKELGCSGDSPSRGNNLYTDLRQLIANLQARDQSTTTLQLSVNNLAALINSESRNGFSKPPPTYFLFVTSTLCFLASQSIASLLDRQRQDQEGLLRALTAGKFIQSTSNSLGSYMMQSCRMKSEEKDCGL
ncbi:hypothetical protein B0H10DRAFT_453225 [Mycena sp. CBHHK59/15]|nr:hypothetical protein B0H10DRAFT_453225 [Mycena sp. CBHHK59/15]